MNEIQPDIDLFGNEIDELLNEEWKKEWVNMPEYNNIQ